MDTTFLLAHVGYNKDISLKNKFSKIQTYFHLCWSFKHVNLKHYVQITISEFFVLNNLIFSRVRQHRMIENIAPPLIQVHNTKMYSFWNCCGWISFSVLTDKKFWKILYTIGSLSIMWNLIILINSSNEHWMLEYSVLLHWCCLMFSWITIAAKCQHFLTMMTFSLRQLYWWIHSFSSLFGWTSFHRQRFVCDPMSNLVINYLEILWIKKS